MKSMQVEQLQLEEIRLDALKLDILCLEDAPFDADLIHEYLKGNFAGEIQMKVVLKEEDFVTAIKEKKYHIILSDFNLPGFNGFKALEHVKAICATTPYICVSGSIGEEAAVELLKQGATDYVSKDKLGRLIFSIERALREVDKIAEKKKFEEELIAANRNLKARNEEISYLNQHDFLTNLHNRIYFEMKKNLIDKENNLPISIIMGDINGLKLINDGFGHAKGDEILIEGARILKKCCREKDIVARIGGDEFGILLPETDLISAQLLCRKIVEAGKTVGATVGIVCPTISIGCATKTVKSERIDAVLRKAEEAMSRQKLLERESAHSSIIASIKSTMFEKSHETAEHAERLIRLSKMIGIKIALDDEQLNELELLATLHDIGKMGIDSTILSKKTALDEKEWYEMKKHPMVGFRIAKATSELIPIANFILCHHERWDGNGYPQGLRGDEIPLLSRIMSIADSFDAMTTDRPYRPGMTYENAIEEIKTNSGTQFDPILAQIFIDLLLTEVKIKQGFSNKAINSR